MYKTLAIIFIVFFGSCKVTNEQASQKRIQLEGMDVVASFISSENLAKRKKSLRDAQESLALNSHFLLEFIVTDKNRNSPIQVDDPTEISNEMSEVYFSMADNIWLETGDKKYAPLSVTPEFNYGLSRDVDYFISFDIPENELKDIKLIVNDQVFDTGVHQIDLTI